MGQESSKVEEMIKTAANAKSWTRTLQEYSWSQFGQPPTLTSLPPGQWKSCEQYSVEDKAELDAYAEYWSKRCVLVQCQVECSCCQSSFISLSNTTAMIVFLCGTCSFSKDSVLTTVLKKLSTFKVCDPPLYLYCNFGMIVAT